MFGRPKKHSEDALEAQHNGWTNDSIKRNLALALLAILCACRGHSGEVHKVSGPIDVDEKGVELTSANDPIEIMGTINRLMITIPADLHVDYDRFAVVDSTDKNVTEITADVRLSNGHVFKFKAYRLPGAPGYPERVLQLEPEPSAHLSGSVKSIRLFSSPPASIPEIIWQSFDNGI